MTIEPHKKKLLIFAYDGTGLGHLMCLAKIASGLSSEIETLIVTGHTAISRIVKNGTKYIQLPNFYDELAKGDKAEADINASRIVELHNIVNKFRPDAFITDFLPLGKRCELQYIVEQYKCLKYFTLRSEIGGERIMHEDVFSPRNIKILIQHYKHIFVTSDPVITSMDIYSWLPQKLKAKFLYSGFVTYHVDKSIASKMRQLKHSSLFKKWIVCSIGGGRVGNELLDACYKLACNDKFNDCFFDIILGEYNINKAIPIGCQRNVCVSKWIDDLYMYHASADIVICSGAYNTLLECMQGLDKKVLSYSVQNPQFENEQQENIYKLGKYYYIKYLENLDDIEQEVTGMFSDNDCYDINTKLNMDGINNICHIIKNDLNEER